MPDSNEEAIKSCNSVAEIRRVEAQSNLPEDMLDCIEPVKILLTKITEPLDPEFNLSYTCESFDTKVEAISNLLLPSASLFL